MVYNNYFKNNLFLKNSKNIYIIIIFFFLIRYYYLLLFEII